ncbi:hypothetical protein OIU76_023167 [Salix suchowensis]|nr:hypothetical protein OIU76_023167 [Salix suchowensis]
MGVLLKEKIVRAGFVTLKREGNADHQLSFNSQLYSSKVKRRFLSLRIHLDVDGAGYDGRYSEGESRYNLSNNIIKAAALEYHAIAIKYSLHPVSLSIAFVLRHPLVASAIFGATKSWQLQEVLKACMIELTPEIIAEINNIHARFPDPCP